MNLSKTTKLSQAVTVTAGAAGTDAIAGTTLDMSGYESVLVTCTFGAIASGAATSIKMQQGNASDMSDAEDLAGTAQTVADDADGKTFYVDLVKPTKRYVRLYVSRATQNATVAVAHYQQYGAKKLPVSHGSNVLGEFHASPAAGTA